MEGLKKSILKGSYKFRLVCVLLIVGILCLSGCTQKLNFLKTSGVILQHYPVSVSYDIKRMGIIADKQITVYLVKLNFKNHGPERVSFVISSLAVIDDSGRVYQPTSDYKIWEYLRIEGIKPPYLGFGCVDLYPKQNTTLTFAFTSLPKKGEIYFEIYDENLNKVESVRLPFAK